MNVIDLKSRQPVEPPTRLNAKDAWDCLVMASFLQSTIESLADLTPAELEPRLAMAFNLLLSLSKKEREPS